MLTTTTTRILCPEPGAVRLRRARVGRRVRWWSGCAPSSPRTGTSRPWRRTRTGGRKVGGLPVAVLDALVDARVADHVLVEADGSAGRPLKAHADHEPVVSPRADLVIAVIGVDCLGAPAGRRARAPGRAAARAARPAGGSARDGGGRGEHRAAPRRLPGAGGRGRREVVVFVNQAATPPALAAARQLAEALRRADAERRLARVVIGDVRAGVFENAG